MGRNPGEAREFARTPGSPPEPAGTHGTPGAFGPALLGLLQDALAREGRFRWRLRGNSMAPTLPPDCEIEIVPVPRQVRPGQLLVFAAGETLIAHRLVRRSQDRWITQGDGRLAPDPALPPEQVLGVVRAAFAGGRQIWPGRRPGLSDRFWVLRHHALRPLRAGRRLLRSLIGRA